jgi:tetratricopeptide (TPR) repeat protein
LNRTRHGLVPASICVALVATACSPGSGPARTPGPPDAERIAAARLDPTYRQCADRFRTLYSAGKNEIALGQARAALEAAPVLREPYVWVSRLSTVLSRNEEAIEFFAGIADENPDLALPLYYKGFNEYNLSRFDDALESFRGAAERDPTDAASLYRQGVVLQLRADFDGAQAALQRSLELDPGSADTLLELSEVLRIQGEFDEARRLVESGLERHPDSAELHHAFGLCLMHERSDEAAEREFREALRLSPDLRVAHEHLARLLARAGREDEARFSRAVSDRLQDYRRNKRTLESRMRESRDGSFAMLLAEVELTGGEYESALRWFNQARRMGGHHDRIAAGRAEALFRAGRLEAGDAALSDSGDWENGRTDLARAARAIAAGESELAPPLLESALARGPEERQFVRRVSDLYAALGETGRAEQLLYAAMSNKPLSTAPDR